MEASSRPGPENPLRPRSRPRDAGRPETGAADAALLAGLASFHPHREAVLRVVLGSTTGILTLLLVVAPLVSRDSWTPVKIYATALAIVLFSLLLVRLRRLDLASAVLSVLLLAFALGLSWFFGGARAPHLIAFAPVLLIVGFLWNERTTIVFSLVASLGVLALVWADSAGALPEPLPIEPLRMWLGFTAVLVMTSILLFTGLRALRSASSTLEYRAFHDSLTGLPNRSALHRDFRTMGGQARADGTSIAVALLDLDRFKEVNDTLGHQVGDELLKKVGPRLASSSVADLAVYRLGGDEFALLIAGLRGREQAMDETRRALAHFDRSFEVRGIDLRLRPSVGLATFPDDGPDSHELLRCADVAMYALKRTTQTVVPYGAAIDDHSPERLKRSSELARAVEEGQLVLHFQPQVALADARLRGFEALVRWEHPDAGLQQPGSFIPLAELSDLIDRLTDWVVESALAQLRRWQEIEPKLTMAVNLSPRSLMGRRCARRIEELLSDLQLDPGSVELEVTETALVSELEASTESIERILASGATVAIDDFGTGYSSLASLRRFEISTLKIDRSFVARMSPDRRDKNRGLVLSTIAIARNLGLRIVAEGIEKAETRDQLLAMGCGLGQGFLYSRALPADRFELEGEGRWRLRPAS